MNSSTVPIFLAPLVEELEGSFRLWELKEVVDCGRDVYVTWKATIFNDVHIKVARRVSKKHGFKLIGFGVRVIGCDTILVTFVLAPRR